MLHAVKNKAHVYYYDLEGKILMCNCRKNICHLIPTLFCLVTIFSLMIGSKGRDSMSHNCWGISLSFLSIWRDKKLVVDTLPQAVHFTVICSITKQHLNMEPFLHYKKYFFMLVASFRGLYCSITHLHVYQCQPTSLMNTQQFYPVMVALSWLVDSVHRASPLYL